MKNALIVWGGNPIHEPEACADITAGILRDEGFDVEVTGDYTALGAEDIAERDLVTPIVTAGQLDKPLLSRLTAAVRAGTGLGSFHAGMATSFREHVEFRYMCGSIWVAHPGDVVTYTVDVTRPDDPIMEGICSFEHVSEQYYLQYDPAIEVLATTRFDGAHDHWRRDVTIPVVYKTVFDQGRVFYSALGHKAAELKLPHVQTILRRGLLWAAR